MIWWTGLAPWELELPFPGSLISTFLVLPVDQGQCEHERGSRCRGGMRELLGASRESSSVATIPVAMLSRFQARGPRRRSSLGFEEAADRLQEETSGRSASSRPSRTAASRRPSSDRSHPCRPVPVIDPPLSPSPPRIPVRRPNTTHVSDRFRCPPARNPGLALGSQGSSGALAEVGRSTRRKAQSIFRLSPRPERTRWTILTSSAKRRPDPRSTLPPDRFCQWNLCFYRKKARLSSLE